MKIIVFGCLVLSLAGGATTRLVAQEASKGRSTAGPATPAPAPSPSELRAAIGRLFVAQERYFADHGSYTTDIAALGLWKPGTVWFRVFHAGGGSWIGEAQAHSEPARSCVAFVGELTDFPSVQATASAQLRPTEEGEPVCDPE